MPGTLQASIPAAITGKPIAIIAGLTGVNHGVAATLKA
jgi:hypothetical protein